jgi:hypothetical protein
VFYSTDNLLFDCLNINFNWPSLVFVRKIYQFISFHRIIEYPMIKIMISQMNHLFIKIEKLSELKAKIIEFIFLFYQ